MCASYLDQTVQAQIAEKLYISTRRVHVSSLAPGHAPTSLGCPLFNFPSWKVKGYYHLRPPSLDIFISSITLSLYSGCTSMMLESSYNKTRNVGIELHISERLGCLYCYNI
jgi:hypothetical protein